jgi:Fe-S-cluster-containing dehydrogenase component/anaerobic selenocysteine-containing dehydrogenase
MSLLISIIPEGMKKNRRDIDRRDFLKLCGYSFAVTALASCRSKITRAIPYVIAPEEITPGEALYYASSYASGSDYCSILVKTRDGRPIKIEGNPESGITAGRTTARVQASVLDLYDQSRLQRPLINGKPAEWNEIDKEITEKLQKISEDKGTIVILTPTIFSPSSEAVISGFLKKFKGSEWVQYDAISHSGMLQANKISFGRQVIPDFRFDLADVVVNMGADFLGTWLSPIEYTRQFSSRRDPDQKMNYLIQLESNLSLTGCNADRRIQIKPSQELAVLISMYNEIKRAVENRNTNVPESPVDISRVSEKLIAAKGKSLVISGSNDLQVQLIVNGINSMLGNIGNTILFDSCLLTTRALDTDMESLTTRMQKGDIKALLLWDVNPVCTYHDRKGFSEGLLKVDLTVSLSGYPDETTNLVQYVCPDNHYLESWNDLEAKEDHFSLMQPAISPIFNTRQMTDSLLKWSGSASATYDFIRNFWTENMLKRQSEFKEPVAFFDHILQKGIFEPVLPEKTTKNKKEIRSYIPPDNLLSKQENNSTAGIEVVLYQSVMIGEGRQANNPWLQELPDPVARICWDNFASLSPQQAKENELKDGDIINIEGIELPVHIQPGQAYGTIGMALGYGHSISGKVGKGTGADVWPMRSLVNGNVAFTKSVDKIGKTGRKYVFAQTQTHHSMEGRALVRTAKQEEYQKDPSAGNELHTYYAERAKSLYPDRFYPHHHWGMAIDLNKCTGCGTCVIACQAENNVPVVGREEVRRVHEMQWMRIDRYYTGSDENPEVLFQPVLCQHCQNAPCENVCPVAATNHSSEGLNQMIYNRCFGTRYCNNNCPYKVRRFNWFNYTGAGTLTGNLRDKEEMTGDLRRMVLNPDVTVRAQGVIEKCSFCIQRIQASKLNAKKENRGLRSNEVQTACAQSCPANAIIFGDMNDKENNLNKLIASGRRYNLLEELYTRPSVNYLTKIGNRIS